MTETTTACPICDSTDIRRHMSHKASGGYGRHRKPWHCRMCEQGFEEPTERRRITKSYLSGLARELEKADPDEVSG